MRTAVLLLLLAHVALASPSKPIEGGKFGPRRHRSSSVGAKLPVSGFGPLSVKTRTAQLFQFAGVAQTLLSGNQASTSSSGVSGKLRPGQQGLPVSSRVPALGPLSTPTSSSETMETLQKPPVLPPHAPPPGLPLTTTTSSSRVPRRTLQMPPVQSYLSALGLPPTTMKTLQRPPVLSHVPSPRPPPGRPYDPEAKGQGSFKPAATAIGVKPGDYELTMKDLVEVEVAALAQGVKSESAVDRMKGGIDEYLSSAKDALRRLQGSGKALSASHDRGSKMKAATDYITTSVHLHVMLTTIEERLLKLQETDLVLMTKLSVEFLELKLERAKFQHHLLSSMPRFRDVCVELLTWEHQPAALVHLKAQLADVFSP